MYDFMDVPLYAEQEVAIKRTLDGWKRGRNIAVIVGQRAGKGVFLGALAEHLPIGLVDVVSATAEQACKNIPIDSRAKHWGVKTLEKALKEHPLLFCKRYVFVDEFLWLNRDSCVELFKLLDEAGAHIVATSSPVGHERLDRYPKSFDFITGATWDWCPHLTVENMVKDYVNLDWSQRAHFERDFGFVYSKQIPYPKLMYQIHKYGEVRTCLICHYMTKAVNWLRTTISKPFTTFVKRSNIEHKV